MTWWLRSKLIKETSQDKISDICESGRQRVDRLLCLFWSVKGTIPSLFSSSPKDGIWSQVGSSGRSNHSIVIWENDGDVVVLEDRKGD